MDQVQLSDRNYISAKRGAEITGYTQDYIGQLCRGGKIPAKRIGSSWYLSESDLVDYKSGKAPKVSFEQNISKDNSFIENGVKYVSSKTAAEITGYAQDYIGQLARNGKIKSRQVGRQWYVAQNELVQHQESISAYNVGFNKESSEKAKIGDVIDLRYKETPKVTYHEDSRPLHPQLKKQQKQLVLNDVLEEKKSSETALEPLVRSAVAVQRAAVALQAHQSVVPSTLIKALSLGVVSLAIFFGSVAISTIEGHISYSRVGDRIVLDNKKMALTENLVSISTNGSYYSAVVFEAVASALKVVGGIVK